MDAPLVLGQHFIQENRAKFGKELIEDVCHGVQSVVAGRIDPFLVLRRHLLVNSDMLLVQLHDVKYPEEDTEEILPPISLVATAVLLNDCLLYTSPSPRDS